MGPRQQLATKAARKSESAAAKPQQQQQQPQQQQQGSDGNAEAAAGDELDYTKLPTMLDAKFEELDTDSALRPTIIKIGPNWTRKSQAGLLSKPVTGQLHESHQKEEKGKAFDLLDALTRSGVLTVAE